MTKKLNLRSILAAALVLAVMLQSVLPAYAADGDKVKVGCFPLNGFCNIAEDGTVSGYSREFTDAVMDLAGWDYEYIRYASWVEALAALSAGDIDILSPSQRTPEREALFSFDSFPIGTEYGSFLTLSTNDSLVYEDYASFDGLKVGVVKSLVFLDDFLDYAERNSFQVDFSYYKDTPALISALNAGEVDAIVANLMVKTDTMKLLAKFGSAPFYYMLSPGSDSLRAELNLAIDRLITQHPEYMQQLAETHFPAYSDIPFSKQELDYIAGAGTLKVACCTDFPPYSYLDESTGELRGADRDVLERISRISGLEFQYVPVFTDDLTADYIKANDIAMVASVEHEQQLQLQDPSFTEPYLTVSKYFIGPAGKSFDVDAGERVAVLRAEESEITRWQQLYPNFHFTSYSTTEACLNALRSKDADLLLSDRYAMERPLAAPQNSDLEFLPAQAITGTVCYQISEAENSVLLISVLNKSIGDLSQNEISQSLDDHLRATRYQYGLSDFAYQYRYALIAAAFVLVLAVAALCVVLHFRRKAQWLIKQDEIRLRNITNNINGGVVVLKDNDSLEITYANKGFLELIGCTKEQFDANGNGSYLTYVHPDDLHKLRSEVESGNQELSLELRIMRTDGSYVPALFNCTIGRKNSLEKELYCVILDLTEQAKLLDELRIESRRTELILERVDEVFYEVDLRNSTISTSGSFAEKLGWELPRCITEFSETVFNDMWRAMPDGVTKLYHATKEMMAEKKPVSTVLRIESKSRGDYIWCDVAQYPILTESGDLASVIGLIRDIDQQVSEREKLMEQARRDQLTGLYNKEAFESLSSDALVQLPDKNHAVIFIDLDHFKSVNDTLGHMVGDRAICEAADKLRIIFSNYDLIARFGGDEFCIFAKDIPLSTLKGKLDWLVDKLRCEYSGERGTVQVSCSCGVACTTDSGFDYQVLMHNADKALYQSKENGRDRYTFFSEVK